ncbi:MAG: alpha/beta fold hydrolase [Acidimicrobiia bacterium]|nr:alpha/beta fold hydrolase [Acidimicrobiia bacterium]
MMTTAMDRALSTDGVVVAVHELGGDGEPLLFVHATMLCGRIWEPVTAHLDGFHAIAPDMRGHGLSTLPGGASVDWRDIASDVLAVIDHLGLDQPRAVGHSMGAACLLLAELARPATFAQLWLYDPVVRPATASIGAPDGLTDTERYLAGGARRRRATFPSRQAAFENFSAKPPLDQVTAEARQAYVEHAFAAQEDGSVTLRCRPEVEAEVYETGARHGAFERLGEVRCPTAVAHGFPEEGRPSSYAPEVASRLAAGREVVFEHLGHFGPFEAPDLVAASIRETFA